mgnify:CR=1 FL=1
MYPDLSGLLCLAQSLNRNQPGVRWCDDELPRSRALRPPLAQPRQRKRDRERSNEAIGFCVTAPLACLLARAMAVWLLLNTAELSLLTLLPQWSGKVVFTEEFYQKALSQPQYPFGPARRYGE